MEDKGILKKKNSYLHDVFSSTLPKQRRDTPNFCNVKHPNVWSRCEAFMSGDNLLTFSVVCTRLYNPLCLFVCLSVCRSFDLSVPLSFFRRPCTAAHDCGNRVPSLVLVADTQSYKRLGPSVCCSVCWGLVRCYVTLESETLESETQKTRDEVGSVCPRVYRRGG